MQFIVSSENGFLRKKNPTMSPIPISLIPIPDEQG